MMSKSLPRYVLAKDAILEVTGIPLGDKKGEQGLLLDYNDVKQQFVKSRAQLEDD